MKRTTSALVAISLVALALLATGCHDYTKDANVLIERANAHVTEYASLDASVQAGADRLSKVAMTPPQARNALEISDGIKETLELQKVELEAAAVDLAKIAKLEVSDEMKAYAKLQIAALKANVLVIEEGKKRFKHLDKIWVAIRDRKGTSKKVDAALEAVQESDVEIERLQSEAAAAQKKASDYFDKNLAQ